MKTDTKFFREFQSRKELALRAQRLHLSSQLPADIPSLSLYTKFFMDPTIQQRSLKRFTKENTKNSFQDIEERLKGYRARIVKAKRSGKELYEKRECMIGLRKNYSTFFHISYQNPEQVEGQGNASLGPRREVQIPIKIGQENRKSLKRKISPLIKI